MILGDLGADVIKVERPQGGDQSRKWGPPFIGSESAYFLAVNRNKRSITVDIASESGKQTMRRLLDKADVFVCNVRKVESLQKVGLDPETVRGYNPRLDLLLDHGLWPHRAVCRTRRLRSRRAGRVGSDGRHRRSERRTDALAGRHRGYDHGRVVGAGHSRRVVFARKNGTRPVHRSGAARRPVELGAGDGERYLRHRASVRRVWAIATRPSCRIKSSRRATNT